jgi:hypothetical protein
MVRLIDRKTGEITFDGVRVTRARPCWVCGHLHRNQSWCIVDEARGLAICPRVESDRKIGDAGWLHRRDGASPDRVILRDAFRHTPPVRDFASDWSAALRARTDDDMAALAQTLKLPLPTVGTVEVGAWRWRSHGDEAATGWCFAMRGEAGALIGLKVRTFDGRKLCATGSRLGLIYARAFDPSKPTLVVTEGESDLMVAASWGLNAVARPGCKAATQTVAALARGKRVMLITDNDEAGRDGADCLRQAIEPRAKEVVTVTPPVKDLRAWAQSGATKADLLWRARHA